jgi:PAS domain S-box-containing protein
MATGEETLIAAARAMAQVQDLAVIALNPAGVGIFACDKASRLFGFSPSERAPAPDQLLRLLPELGRPSTAGPRWLSLPNGRALIERRAPVHFGEGPPGWLLTLRESAGEPQPQPRWRALSQVAGIGVAELTSGLVFLRANDHLGALLDLSAEALIGRSLVDVVPPDQREELVRLAAAALSGGVEQLLFEAAYPLSGLGTEAHLRWIGAPYVDHEHQRRGFVFLVEDRTALVLAERALSRTLTELRSLVDGLPVGLFIQRGGVLAHANPSLARILGAARVEDLVGQPVSALLPASADGAEVTGPLPFQSLDGRALHLELRSGAELDFDGGPGRVSIVVDVTEATRLRAQLAQSERLSSLGTLSAGIAHEINNPLGYVMVNLDYARAELANRVPELLPAIDEALDGAGRIRTIVRAVKAFARGGDERRERVDVNAVMETALRMVAGSMAPGVELVRQLGEVPAVRANEAHLCQVFVNLLMNAVHAVQSRPRRQIRLRSRRDESGGVEIAVSDTGHGIKLEHMGLIFDPFFTTKDVGEGMGLGLSVSYGIVRALAGTLTAESQLDQGSTFTVRLAADPAPVAPIATPAPTRGRAAVLVIDDDVRVANAISRTLAKFHDTVAEIGAAGAIRRLRAGERFDVLLCDLMMPGISGAAFYQVVREERPELLPRLIFVTGGGFGSETEGFLRTVPNPVVEKPVDTRRLLSLIDELRSGRAGAQA